MPMVFSADAPLHTLKAAIDQLMAQNQRREDHLAPALYVERGGSATCTPVLNGDRETLRTANIKTGDIIVVKQANIIKGAHYQ